MSQTVETVTRVVPTPIHSVHGKNRAFLEIVPQGNRVRVQPTYLGKDNLNRFWTMWLRHLILTKTDTKLGFGVELYGGNVVVSATNATPGGLHATVVRLAAEIKPLMHFPLERWNNRNNQDGTSFGPIEWEITRPNLPVAMILDAIPLPKGSSVKYDPRQPWGSTGANGSISLRYKNRNRVLTGHEQALLVELHFALACCT